MVFHTDAEPQLMSSKKNRYLVIKGNSVQRAAYIFSRGMLLVSQSEACPVHTAVPWDGFRADAAVTAGGSSSS